MESKSMKIKLGEKGDLAKVIREVLACQKCSFNGFGNEDGNNEYQLLFFPCEKHEENIQDLIKTGHVYR